MSIFQNRKPTVSFKNALKTITNNITTMGIEELILHRAEQKGIEKGKAEGKAEGKSRNSAQPDYKTGIE